MKASNKLLIAFFLFMPLSMLVFNLLLKYEYVKGNIQKTRLKAEELNIKHELKPFRHVEFNGRIYFEKGYINKPPVGAKQQLYVKVRKDQPFHLEVDPRKAGFLKYAYKGDTLVLTYKVNELKGRDYFFWDGQVTITAPEISSIKSIEGDVSLLVFEQDAALNMNITENSTLSMRLMNVPALNLELGSSIKAELLTAEIDTLCYRLGSHSELSIRQPYSINVLQPVAVDSSSTITLTGDARQMRNIVPLQLGKIVTKQ